MNESPLAVEIVRPKKSKSELVASVIGNWVEVAVTSWLVMLLLPTFTPLHLGYWPTVAALVVVRGIATPHSQQADRWSRARKTTKK